MKVSGQERRDGIERCGWGFQPCADCVVVLSISGVDISPAIEQLKNEATASS